MEILLNLLTEPNLTLSSHLILVAMIFMLYRRLLALERQLINIAAATNTLADMFDVNDKREKNPDLDGREP